MVEDVIRRGRLLDLYGMLLTEKQQKCMCLYYEQDWSLSEISEALAISRQGVYDLVKRSVQILENYELHLGFLDKQDKIKRVREESLALLRQEKPDIKKVCQLLEAVDL
ncbi:YlxM family DNA-binding protein [uncultured Megasphaera sp.]|uniref:YlxM family DNA-binding protein n=1 Tax=uncultured Megasphaera sp. TaxID=165188 RepID=UPI0025973EE6|nr:sigma factor-like helix-turn-helix DNA-binding protein [uncultured Megasphaera sp.]